MFKHILIPTDGSTLPTEALEKTLDFARDIHAQVTVLALTEPLQSKITYLRGPEIAYADCAHESDVEADQILAAARKAAEDRSLVCDTVKMESAGPAGCIVHTAELRGCDVIAMASHGRSDVRSFMLDAITIKVLADCKLPVLVYR